MKLIIFNIFKRVVRLFSGKGLGRFDLVRRLWPIAASSVLARLKPDYVNVDGHELYLDKRDSLSLSVYGVYEALETETFKQQLKAGDVVVDIGANIGYYTLLAARQVGPEGRVYAFEPEPENFRLLKKNVEANGYANVECIQEAVTDNPGRLRLFLSEANFGDHRLYEKKAGRRAIEIKATSLDDYFKDRPSRIDFIKMDIQGAEGRALRGMKNVLAKNPGLKILTEFWPTRLLECGVDAREFMRLIAEAGFECYDVSDASKPLKPAEILKDYPPESDRQTNLLLKKTA